MADELIKISDWNKLSQLYKAGDVPMPFVQELFLLDCEIAGTGFIKNMEEKASKLADGAPLSLIREAQNKYDSLAIRIENDKGEKLGYIPRRKNEVLARLMDGGKFLYGKVVSTEISGQGNWVDIFIKVFMKDL